MQPTNKQEQERLFGTDNCMLVTNKYQYEGTTGGKSGWTEEAGYTMVELSLIHIYCAALGRAGLSARPSRPRGGLRRAQAGTGGPVPL